MQKFLLLLLLYISSGLFAQTNLTPSEKQQFSKITTYDELGAFINQLDKESNLLEVEITGQSVQGRNLYAMKFSKDKFGSNPSKIRVLIFAQQHGNEQSGKEGALLLARELIKPENLYLFDKFDLALIPQVNPDGSEINTRRNANQADLNRNHLILTEPETMVLHRFFDKHLFEVTMDVHEYSPYGENWKKAGFRKNSQVTVGTTTNLNVSETIREFSAKKALPYLFDYLNDRNYSSFVYCPGDPPGTGYTRHSTFDINDGRQSFGIQNTLSFIQEGMNGADDYTENLEIRSTSQMAGMRGLLEFVYLNSNYIAGMVNTERKNLLNGIPNSSFSIQSEHIPNGQILKLPVYSYTTHKDSIVEITDYRPVVSSIADVKKPFGYLVPADLAEITDWAGRQNLLQLPYQYVPGDIIKQYFVKGTETIDFEGDTIINPLVELKTTEAGMLSEKYILIPTAQLKGNLAVSALEPKSMLGLVTYEKYKHLLKPGETYPILRITKP
ncbi:MAG: M14 family zinc carboxypeptidase [Lentimicrobium sp.]